MKASTTKNNNKIFFFIAIPISAIIILYSFWGIWGTYQVGDDAGAVRMAQSVNEGNPSSVEKLSRTFIAITGASHWTPINTIALYSTLVDDSNFRIVIINISILLAASVFSGYLSIRLGVQCWAAIICSLLVASSQALVIPLSSCWGIMNMLPAIFLMIQALITWKWVKISFDTNYKNIRWNYILGFILVLMMAILTKETGIKGIFLFAVLFITCFYNQNRFFLRDIILLLLLTASCLILYFAIRHFYANAVMPLLGANSALPDYQVPRLGLFNITKNITQLLFGSINVVDSYNIYLNYIRGNKVIVILSILPAVSSLIILLACWLAALRKRNKSNNLNLNFIAFLILCSLLPECMLGKVSEMYVMTTLCFVSIFTVLILNFYVIYNQLVNKYRYVMIFILAIAIFGNIYSSRAKVKEVLKSGNIAHRARMDMIELTKDLPVDSKIAVIFNPQSPSNRFSRFGEKGIQSGYGNFLGRPHQWYVFPDESMIPDHKEYHMILIENESQTGLLPYISQSNNKIYDQ